MAELKKQKIFVWNPEPSPIIKKIIDSLIYQILFEGVILIYKQGEKVEPIRQLIHWIMSEDTMRVSAITIIVMIPLSDNPNADPIDEDVLILIPRLPFKLVKAKYYKEFDMDSFDSKQPRNLIMLDQNELENLEQDKREQYFDFSVIANNMILAREMSK